MQKEFEVLSSINSFHTDTKEQLVENELVLPDYYPEISKILKCSVCLVTEDVTRSGDRVSASGKADIKLIYLDENRHINIFNSASKYTRVFTGVPAQNEDCFCVKQTLTSVDYRATAPRKCEVRLSAAVKLTCLRKESINALSELGDCSVEVLGRDVGFFSADAVANFNFRFSETVDLPVAEGKITGVLYTSQSAEFQETKAIKSKIMMKGVFNVNSRFVTDSGSITPEALFTVPFTEITGIPGADEGNECVLFPDDICSSIVLNEDGKTAQITLGANITAVCGNKKQLKLPADIYSVRSETVPKFTKFDISGDFENIDKSFAVNGTAECYDDTLNRIDAGFTEGCICSLSDVNGTGRIDGSVSVNFLVSSSGQGFSLISRSCNFTEDILLKSGCTAAVDCNASVVFADIKNGKIDYKLRITLRGCSFLTEAGEFITDVEIPENSEKNIGCEKIVLYYAQKGESIWTIAKENSCSAGKIRELNNLTAETVEENKMLILMK